MTFQPGSAQPNSPWATSDLQLASWLRFRGCEAIELRPISGAPSRYEVVFAQTDALRVALEEWERGDAGDFQKFADIHDGTFRWLKGVMRAMRGAR